MEKVMINGVEYSIPKVDFNALVKLEKKGLTMSDLVNGNIGFVAIEAILSWVMDCTPTKAGEVITEMVAKEGVKAFECLEPVVKAIVESDFFKSLTK